MILFHAGVILARFKAESPESWKVVEAEAKAYNKSVSRDNWRLVVNMHCAEDDETAMRDVRVGERIETQTYFSETLGRPPMRSENPLQEGLAAATTLVLSLIHI